MEIMYVIAIVAVFVLCLALLSTARRILRSSPLASGSLTLSSPYDEEHFDAIQASDYLQEEEMALSNFKARNADYSDSGETPSDKNNVVTHAAIETARDEFNTQPVLNSPIAGDDVAVDKYESAMTYDSHAEEVEEGSRVQKSSRRTYNYALECLLLGISAWVLIKTQQSNLRYRLPRAHQDRVA